MEHLEQFIDNLIALKNYYQQQIEEYQRLAGHTREQLNHVNALLFDQMEQQYKQQHEQLSKKEAKSETAARASVSVPQNISSETSQLDFHSLLLDSTQFSTQLDLKEPAQPLTTDLVKDEQPSAANTTNEFNQPPDIVEPAITKPFESAVEPDISESNEPSIVESAATAKTNYSQSSQQLAASPIATPDSKRPRYAAALKTPLLPAYQHLTKSEAVENFLQDNEGKTFHIDDITRGLHGELEADAIRAERSRMYDTLKKGVAKGLWSAVPNFNNYYTIDLKSLAPTGEQQ